MKKILFITGTRADYGKIKPIIKAVDKMAELEPWIYVCGMHLLEKYGGTYREVLKDNFDHVYVEKDLEVGNNMAINLANLILKLTAFITKNKFDLIVVHGDRTDALGGAISGVLNNIKVAHIEGGELSGTIDDSLRHAISKLSHFHFVCNNEAKRRLIQMGEDSKKIFVIGSPDIDVMFSKQLPSIDEAKNKYGIKFTNYSIMMFHPVTTEVNLLKKQIKMLVDVIIDSKKQYIVIFPNNDLGSDIIINEYKRLSGLNNFVVFPSLRFEYFLTLLKHSDFMIGNSSAGIRETCVYGIPSIDVGSRQFGRYNAAIAKNIIHSGFNYDELLSAIKDVDNHRFSNSFFGNGNSVSKFINVLESDIIWTSDIQKKFFDIDF
ncbi:MAG: UDP-N-acetylglucosamine 2-epimerase (hydrolyzing) [Bacilli bacterium]|nr:UDP-N-acetylglucosamine 2-epimerase (hydrolyzing) [Bacilli bacterium]